MLKIKEQIDLKELEKFGFEIQPSSIECNDTYCNGDIEVLWDRTIHYTAFDNTFELDTIYDLIKAGLVEKVEEE